MTLIGDSPAINPESVPGLIADAIQKASRCPLTRSRVSDSSPATWTALVTDVFDFVKTANSYRL
jgi:hypothetical protein